MICVCVCIYMLREKRKGIIQNTQLKPEKAKKGEEGETIKNTMNRKQA